MVEAPAPRPLPAVLLVDDSKENLTAFEALLKDSGATLLLARSGTEALEHLLQHEVALALLDVNMPQMDGFELAELMRGAERTRNVPIIFVTAASREQSRAFRGYEAGAVDFLYKPIEPHVLRTKVEVFLQLHAQRQQMAEQLDALKAALRMNELFTAVLGHDLRNPLNAILGSAQFLLMNDSENAPAQRIKTSAERMWRMIEQLLDFERVRQGRPLPVEPRATDLAQVCERICAEHESPGAGRRVDLDVKGNAMGQWDGDRLGQVVSNLVSNALKHGEPGRTVRLGLDGRAAEQVTLTVQNAGVIPADDLPHVFEPFRSGSGRQGADGLGLGLYIVERLVAAHGGHLQVRSSDREGTVFQVDLPRQGATTH